MTLAEFRKLTAHLDGDMELTAGGGDVVIVWHDQRSVSIDDGMPWLDDEDNATVIFWRGGDPGSLGGLNEATLELSALVEELAEEGGATG